MDMRIVLLTAVVAGLALGALLALAEQPRVQVTIMRADPAAYEIAGLLEEARRITEQAARDE